MHIDMMSGSSTLYIIFIEGRTIMSVRDRQEGTVLYDVEELRRLPKKKRKKQKQSASDGQGWDNKSPYADVWFRGDSG